MSWEVIEKSNNEYALKLGDNEMPLARQWGAVVWPGHSYGFCLAGCQTKDGQVYLLREKDEYDWADLTRHMVSDLEACKVEFYLREHGSVGEGMAYKAAELIETEMLISRTNFGFMEAPYGDMPSMCVVQAYSMIQRKKLKFMPDLTRLLAELKKIKTDGMGVKEILANLDEMPAFNALMLFLGVVHAWPLSIDSELDRQVPAPADKRTGI